MVFAATSGAVYFQMGAADVEFNSTFSYGASFRVEDRDWDHIGKTNQPEYLNNPAYYSQGSGHMPPGAWSANSDDGNLNFDTGLFSSVVKGTHDLNVRFDRFGMFARAHYFYDYYLMDHGTEYTDVVENEEAKDQHGRNFEILDIYGYADFDIGNVPSSIQVGKQVINWGESAYIPHGISDFNPIDMGKLRVPGAELKEAFIPLGSAKASFGLTPNLSVEGFYQFEWDASKLDGPGTYFSTMDFIGDGGNYVHIHFAQEPDVHAYGPEYPWIAQRLDDMEPSDSGQFGLRMTYFMPRLNDTEVALYYSNYHSRRPVLNAYGHDGTWLKGSIQYPEDIKLYGLSFNTVLPGGFSLAGECSYREDEPIQVDDVEVVFKAVEALGPLSLVPLGTSQLEGDYGMGDFIPGYIRLDTFQSQLILTRIFSRILGATQLVFLAEAGFLSIRDMPDEDELRLDAPGTHRSGNPDREGRGIWFNEPEGVETDSRFADDFSAGYVLRAQLQYPDIYKSINFNPMLLFSHDFMGTSPTTIGNFIQHRKSLTTILNFDYMRKYSLDLGYKVYWGGGHANGLSDRDYVYFTIKYSI